MSYLYLKAIHIIFVVTWFSGMFYLGRLFIYNREAQDKDEPEKSILQKHFSIMISRLYWAITFPSALLTLLFGSLIALDFWPFDSWLWLKLMFVVLLYFYQITLHQIFYQQKTGIFRYSSQQLRFWNEIPTILLVAIVMLVVIKHGMSLVYGIGGLILLMLLITAAITLYKNFRSR